MRTTGEGAVELVHVSHDGRVHPTIKAHVVKRGKHWMVVDFRYRAEEFDIPRKYGIVELHVFDSHKVWVAQFIDGKKAFRNYYNINESVSIKGQRITYKDLILDVLEDASGMKLKDVDELGRSCLTAKQSFIVWDALADIVNGKVRELCSSTFPLKPLAKRIG